MASNLLLTGGIGHPFDDAAASLAALLTPIGIASEITTDIEGGLARLARGGFDLVTIYALRWRMLDNEKYAPHRARWGFSLSEAGRRALAGHVAAGGGLLGLHTAVLCFDDWPEWQALLGGAWVWGQSFHPPRGPLRARMTPSRHAITAGLPEFALDNDEVYGALALLPDVEPLAVAAADAPAGAAEWPVLWARSQGRGRVVYDALGHDRASLENPVHRRLVVRGAVWACGGTDTEILAI